MNALILFLSYMVYLVEPNRENFAGDWATPAAVCGPKSDYPNYDSLLLTYNFSGRMLIEGFPGLVGILLLYADQLVYIWEMLR